MKVCCFPVPSDTQISDLVPYTGTDPEEEKAEQAALTEKFEPLIDWLRKEVREKGAARDGTCLPTSSAVFTTSSNFACSHHLEPSCYQLLRDRRRRVWLHRQPRETYQ